MKCLAHIEHQSSGLKLSLHHSPILQWLYSTLKFVKQLRDQWSTIKSTSGNGLLGDRLSMTFGLLSLDSLLA
jgi:hypothetical protein